MGRFRAIHAIRGWFPAALGGLRRDGLCSQDGGLHCRAEDIANFSVMSRETCRCRRAGLAEGPLHGLGRKAARRRMIPPGRRLHLQRAENPQNDDRENNNAQNDYSLFTPCRVPGMGITILCRHALLLVLTNRLFRIVFPHVISVVDSHWITVSRRRYLLANREFASLLGRFRRVGDAACKACPGSLHKRRSPASRLGGSRPRGAVAVDRNMRWPVSMGSTTP